MDEQDDEFDDDRAPSSDLPEIAGTIALFFFFFGASFAIEFAVLAASFGDTKDVMMVSLWANIWSYASIVAFIVLLGVWYAITEHFEGERKRSENAGMVKYGNTPRYAIDEANVRRLDEPVQPESSLPVVTQATLPFR